MVICLIVSETAELRPEALCALTNIASTECTRAVIQEPDAIPTLKALLSGPERNLREQVIEVIFYRANVTRFLRFRDRG